MEPAVKANLFDGKNNSFDESWNFPDFNPWILLILAGLSFWVYQKFSSYVRHGLLYTWNRKLSLKRSLHLRPIPNKPILH